jgi:putative ABC transport system permease protein
MHKAKKLVTKSSLNNTCCMIKNYFKIAWRNISKNKVFSSVNILGLALSMACCLIISMYVFNELSYDSFHKNLPDIYRITEKQDQAGTLYDVAVTPGPLAPALQKDFPEIQNTVRFGNWGGALKNGSNTFEENNILLTENSVFIIFNFPLLKGNPATALHSPDEIIITEKIAIKYFGNNWKNNPALIGQIFTLNGQTDFKLAGVANDLPQNSSIQFDILLPITYLFASDEWSNKWNSNNYHTYLQLKSGSDVTAFQNKIAKQLHVYNSDTKDLLQLQPLKEQYLYSKFDFHTDWGKRSNIKYVQIFAGVGLLLLIIACVNFINLSTARSLKRSMEVGVRKVNGASRKQLIFQFLTESILVVSLSAVLSLFILEWAQPYLESFTGKAVNINIYSPLFIGFFLLFILIIGLLAGLYPAFVMSSFKPVSIFKSSSKSKSGKSFWKGLVVFQFVVSIALMVCTFFMYRQLLFLQSKDLGFNKEQLISIGLKGTLKEKSSLLKRDIELQPDVIAVSSATMSMVNVDNSTYMEWEGMQPDDKFLITQANVDPDFIPALGMQLLNGHNFSPQKTNDTANFIVNETAVKRMGYTVTNAIGKKVDVWGAKGAIIGVVKDFNFKSLNTTIDPFIFRYQPQDRYFNLFVKIAPGNTAATIAQIQKVYKQYDTEFPMSYNFVNESINNLYLEDTRTANLIMLFAILTVFVGCLGLFGLTVFAAEQRIKEIGIRKVLGAGVTSITGLLSKDFLKLVLLATIIAIPLAWYITVVWLQNYAYRIQISWWVFAMAACIILFLACITISAQAIKAAMANPVKSLRSE